MEFTIDRSKWRCGGEKRFEYGGLNPAARGSGDVFLLNDRGFMCCLGQVMKQEGFTDDELFEEGEPMYVEAEKDSVCLFDNQLRWQYNSHLAIDAICINDDRKINQRERERRLRELFEDHGHKIKFVGKAVKGHNLTKTKNSKGIN